MNRFRSRASLCLYALLSGCGGGETTPTDLGTVDASATPADFSVAAPDLAGADLAVLFDVGVEPDFQGIDFRMPPTPDLAGMAPNCMDTVRNGDETDVDCGGARCSPCDTGKLCRIAADCKTGLCLNLVCSMPQMAKLSFGPPASFAAGTLPGHVVAGDINGDGKVDLVVANQGTYGKVSDVSVLIGKGDGTFNAQARYPAGFSPARVLAIDVNGDQRDDVAVANTGAGNIPGGLSVLLAGAQGVLGNAANTQLGGSPGLVVGGDFNRDGKKDLLVAESSPGKAGNADVFLGLGNGAFPPPAGFAVGSTPSDAVIADWNGDGVPDLAVANGGDFAGPALVALHLGGPNGTFKAGVSVLPGPGTTMVAAGDLDGDGKMDLVSTFTKNNVATLGVLLGKGDGTFQPPLTVALRGADPAALALADLDRDGKLDVAVQYRSGTVGVLAGTGNGNTQPEAGFTIVANMGGSALVAADLDGDKKPDLVATDLFKNTVVVMLNTTP